MAITAVLDTNIFLIVKNKEEPHYEFVKKVLDAVDNGRMQAVISVISVAELCVGYYSAGDEKGRQELIAHLASSKAFSVIEINLGIADAAAKIRSETGLRLPDAIIVATGLAKGATYIVTHDEELGKANRYLEVVTSQEMIKRFG